MKLSVPLWTAALLFAALPVAAQDTLPSTIKIVVPFPAGATLDNVARLLSVKLKDELKTNVVVENRGGAAGNIGADYVLRAPADGSTYLFTAPATLVVNKHLYPKIGFDHKSFAPVSLVASSPFVWFVNPKLGIKTLPEFVAYAKAHPSQPSYGSMGVGTASHLIIADFNATAGTTVLHVPFQGAAPALTALVGGQVDSMTTGLTSTLAYVEQGKLIPIAITSEKRNPKLPNVPALVEYFPNMAPSGNWFAFLAPAATPPATADRFAKAVQKVLADPEVKKSFEKIDVMPIGSTPAELSAYMDKEAKIWGDVIVANNISAE